MYKKSQNRLFNALEGSHDSPAGRVFSAFIIILILLNVLAVVVESVDWIMVKYFYYFRVLEAVSITIFTVEYILRLWSCTSEKKYHNPVLGRIKFFLTPLALVDLMSFLPFYLPFLIPVDLRFLRAIRILRVVRVFKLGRYSESLKTFEAVIRDKKEDLFVTFLLGSIIMVVSSSMMYLAENQAQPKVFSSIPATMWWAIVTLTTVGYGDIYPMTVWGKILGAVFAFTGVGMFALPAGILGSGFIEEIQKKRVKKTVCPHCGKEIQL